MSRRRSQGRRREVRLPATITQVAELYLPAPQAGANVTTTQLYSLVANGDVRTNGLMTALGGATVVGGAIALNTNSNFNISLATGTSTGTITIGNSGNTGKTVMAGLATGTNADTLCLSAGNVVLIQAGACTISRARFKENIREFTGDALAQIDALPTVTFTLKPTNPSNRDRNAQALQVGLLAEDVAKIMPLCAIYEQDMKTPKSYRQECVIAYLVRGMQEQQKEIASLQNRPE